MLEIMHEIQKVMEEKGIKPYQLHKDSPLSKSTLSNLFRRNAFPRIDTFIYICEALHECPCRFLCGFDCQRLKPEEMRLLELYNNLNEPYQKFIMKSLEEFMRAVEMA